MDKKTALQILTNALDAANQRGCYTIFQSKEIIEALDFLISQPDIEFGKVVPIEKPNE